MRLIALMCVLCCLPAVAEDKRVSVPVGYSTTLDLGSQVKKVTLSDPSVVEVRSRGRKLTLVGQRQGSSEAVVKTRDGTMRFAVYVASDKYALPY